MSVPVTRRRFGTLLSAIPALPLVVSRVDAAGSEVHEVTIQRLVFEPADLIIAVGDRVRWTNLDVAPHTATALDGGWDTGELGKGDAGALVFNAAGVFDYLCVFHPHMKGRVVVEG